MGVIHFSNRRAIGALATFMLLGGVLLLPARVGHSQNLALQTTAPAATPMPAPAPGVATLQDLKSFATLGSVLYVAAHPDDENSQLITYLSRGRNYRTAYLSVTRGDGGQNLLGPEFGEELGLIRTHELLAARHIDGGRQFFTRAIDFGYSKSPDETLRIWDRQAVLGDVVRVIRTFRPDAIVAGFSPVTTPGQHGHHTASAILAGEAFKLAGDPKSYPEQLTPQGGGLTVWQPTRLLQNNRFGGRGGRGGAAPVAGVRVNVGGTDPVTGETFAYIAWHSRSQHKTQGFDRSAAPTGGGGAQYESFAVLQGEPATTDIMDGVDTTWARVKNGGAEIAKLIDDAVAKYNPQDPAASVPALLAIHKKVAALAANDPVVAEKRKLLDRVIQECLGLKVETTVAQVEAVPGENIKLTHTATESASIPVRWTQVVYPGKDGAAKDAQQAIELHPGQTATRQATRKLPADMPLSQPYWLREEPGTGLYTVSDPKLIGQPINPPNYPIEEVFEVGGEKIMIPDEPVEATAPESPGATAASAIDRRRTLEVIAPVTLQFAAPVRLFAPGETKSVEIEATAAHAGSQGKVSLGAPEGWKVEPAERPLSLAQIGDTAKFVFNVTAPAHPTKVELAARVEVGGSKFDTGRIEVNYPHVPPLLMQPPARLVAVDLDMKTRGKTVGYFPGAGDSVADCISQMGYTIKTLTPDDLTTDGLRGLDAVVLGVRASDTHSAQLTPRLPALFSYVAAGGTLIVQYNRQDVNRSDPGTYGPFVLQQSANRVTDENAAVTFLAPDHPALTTPNKITADDFTGWVQEQGIYYPSDWDKRFTTILASSDPGEEPLPSGLLVAHYGKGYFVYTSLVFFRELPAGVPGAYRLFANLLALGKP